MKPVWTKEVDEILGIGIKLSQIGLSNWALTKSQAICALEQLEALKISILGGDVYQSINGVIKLNYDNWFCEQLGNEPKEAFIKRSISKAKDYINNYPDVLSEIYFVIVPDA